MLRKYKNGFINVIIEKGLNPDLFSSKEEIINNVPYFIISLSNTPLNFNVCEDKEAFEKFRCKYVYYSTAYPYSETMPTNFSVNIDDIYKMFSYWLDDEVRECLEDLETPDLWDRFERQKQMFQEIGFGSNDSRPFSSTEKTAIRKAIKDFHLLLLKEFEPTRAELSSIENRFDYLNKSLDRLNKFDWKSILISTVISISIALSLDSERGKSLFEILKKTFTTIISLNK